MMEGPSGDWVGETCRRSRARRGALAWLLAALVALPTSTSASPPPAATAADPCAPWPAQQPINEHLAAMRTRAAAAAAQAWWRRCDAAAGSEDHRRISALLAAAQHTELAGDIAAALVYRQRLVAITEALPPQPTLSRTSAWLLWATTLLRVGRRAEAVDALERAERALTADRSLTASASRAGQLQTLAMLHGNLQRFGPALRLIDAARAVMAADAEALPIQVLSLEVTLATLHWLRGDLATAAATLQRMLLRAEALAAAPAAPIAATATPAERAVAQARAQAGEVSPVSRAWWWQMLMTLARLHGDSATAERAASRAEALFRAEVDRTAAMQGGPMTALAIGALTALAGHWQQTGRWQAADDMHRQARAAAGRWPQATAAYLDTLDLQRARGLIDAGRSLGEPTRIDVAMALLEPIVARGTAASGELWTVSARMALAEAYHARGRYAEAAALDAGVVRTYDQLWGPRHQVAAVTRGQYADALVAAGRPREALPVLEQILVAIDGHLSWVLAVGGEQDQRQALDALRMHRDRLLTLLPALVTARVVARPRADELAYGMVLRHKGRLLDAMARALHQAERRSDPAVRALLAKLREVRAALAALALAKPAPEERDQQLARIAALEEQARRLELDLAARSPALAATTAAIDIAALRQRLPARTVLVEYAWYRDHDPRQPPGVGLPQPATVTGRFAAFVLARQGPVVRVDLGPAAPIEREVEVLRRHLQRPRLPGIQARARALDARIFEPLQAHIAGADTVLVAADGALDLVPFAALVAPDGRWRLEQATFVALSSGRDLLRLDVRRPPRGGPLILGDPEFGDPNAVGPAAAPTATAPPILPDEPQRSGDFATMRWSPLPGSAEEARAVAAELPGATLLLGPAATEAALRAVRAPAVLHIATHGFFLPMQPQLPAASQQLPENPLIRSGIVLAGVQGGGALAAIGAGGGGGDGVLTALEAGDLDLDGTALVVLSACETAVGDLREGDGVQGLRRTLAIAGAESLLSSLWKVDDAATRDLMVATLRGVRAGLGRAEALRRAQRAMAADPARRHPYYWAAFVLAGRWDPVR